MNIYLFIEIFKLDEVVKCCAQSLTIFFLYIYIKAQYSKNIIQTL